MNSQVGARTLGNAGILTVTQLIAKVLGTVFLIIAARKLTVEDYGLYVFSSTYGTAFGMVVVFGFPRLITRSVARDLRETGQVLGRVLVLEAALLALMLAAMAAGTRLLGYSGDRMWIVIVGGCGALLVALLEINASFFRAHQRMDLEAAVRLPLSVLNLILGAGVLLAGLGLAGLVVTQLGIYGASVAAGTAIVMWKLGRPSFTRDWRAHRDILVMTAPFALYSVLIYLYQSMDVVILSLLKGDEACGLFAGAKNFVAVFGVLPLSLGGAYLPVLCQFSQGSGQAWSAVLRRLLKYSLVAALPITVGLVVVSDQVVPLVLGQQYRESGLILQCLALLILLSFTNSALSNGLVSVDGEKTLVRIVGGVVVFSVMGQLLLVPVWGAYGAAAASLLTAAAMLAAQIYAVRKQASLADMFGTALRPLASVAIMALAVLTVRGLGLLPTILVGAVVYPAALFALRSFEPDELEMMPAVWRTRLSRYTAWLKRGRSQAAQ